ncbi:MAG: PASTA domain-containing protein [Chthonomonas sp.]|nr:PASTA domain-containing protein [Chthonomonas sp.]
MIGTLLRIRYEVIQELEEGPIFHAYRVRDRVAGREVKVRMIQPPFSEEPAFLDRVREVISISSALQHGSLERLMELDEHEGQPFIVSELPPGTQLQSKVRKLAPFSAHVAIGTAIGVCEALSVLHSENQCHGDVSSANVFVTQEGKVKLGLPGMWSAYASSRTAAAIVLPEMAPYMAPEVSQGAMLSPRSDIYGVGVMLFELLTAKYPFSADSPNSMAEKHATAPVPSLRMSNPGVPAILEEIVKKAMAKSPNDRYQDAQTMLSDLRVLQDALRFGKQISWPIRTTGPTPAPTPEPGPQLVAPKMSVIQKEPREARPTKKEEEIDLSDSLPRWLVALAYLAMLAILALIGVYLFWNVTSPKLVRVPNLVGQNAIQAGKDLEDLGLKLKVQEVVSDKPEGRILEIDPPADTRQKSGETIYAKVSGGRRIVEIPDVLGLEVREARDLLTKSNLKVEVKEVPSRDFSKGQVVRQNPKPRTQIEKGSTIQMFVSNGSRGSNEPSRGERRGYEMSFTLTAPIAVRVRIDMIDDNGTEQVYEEDHQPGDVITVRTAGYGDNVVFKIFYDGEFVAQRNAPKEQADAEART